MTPKQQERIKTLEAYVREQREKHFFGKEEHQRSPQDIAIKEICTNVLAWCILIKGDQ